MLGLSLPKLNQSMPTPVRTSLFTQAGLLQRLQLDPVILFFTLLLMGFGLLVIYSATGRDSHFVERQAIHDLLGLVIMLLLAKINTSHYRNLLLWFYLALTLMIALTLVIGQSINGSQRWLNLYFFSLQPSELMKVVLPAFSTHLICRGALPIRWRGLLRTLLILIIPCGLIYLQPDLGTALLLAFSALVPVFLAGLRWRILGILTLLLSLSLPLAWFFLLHSYHKQRILALFNPSTDPYGSGWQVLQSKVAIGSGGITGNGWLNSFQAQLDFLPEAHTDFILAVIGEQFGFLGIAFLLLLYFALFARCAAVSLSNQSHYDRILGLSYTAVFSVYVIVNIGMVTGSLPTVGVPLMLISYGGSSTLSFCLMLGTLMSIGSHRKAH